MGPADGQEGNSPLDLAANNTHRELAEILLENKADPNTRDKVCPACMPLHRCNSGMLLIPLVGGQLGNTALHRAAQGNHYHFAEVLLAKGALQNVKNEVRSTYLPHGC